MNILFIANNRYLKNQVLFVLLSKKVLKITKGQSESCMINMHGQIIKSLYTKSLSTKNYNETNWNCSGHGNTST